MWDYENESSFSIDRKNPLGKAAALGSNRFSKLQYRVDATRRAYHRSLKALKELKAEAAAAPVPAIDLPEPPGPPSLNPSPQTTSLQIGFVPPFPSTDPLRPAPPPPSPSPDQPPPFDPGYPPIR
jgi:hypothetical protein